MGELMVDDRNEPPGKSDLHSQALRHADEVYVAERENLEKGRDAQRFYVGEQWPDKAKMVRDKEGRPVLTINRLPAFIRQVTGDVRKDTPTMRFLPAKDGATQEVAEVITGLVRNIEQNSNAKAAYVTATENACQAGIGWIRVNTEYSDDDSFDQDIRIRRITDPFAVLCDPSAQEPDKADARFMFVLEDMPTEEFTRQYPDASLDPFPSASTGGMVWKTEKTTRVAEYWYRKPVKKTLYLLADGSVSEKLPAGVTAQAERKVETTEIWQCIVTGGAVIRKEQLWAGRYFPFAPVIGEELRLDGRTVRKGMVHDARDAQQAYNYMRTAAVEATALQPKAPFMVTVNQIKGLEDKWAALGSSNPPFLLFNADPLMPNKEPTRAQPAMAQTGLDSQAALAANELEAITGIYKANLGAPSNETSGRAIVARQREGDTGTYLYIDNLATALRRVGLIVLDLIPRIYDTPRMVRVLKEDGTQEMQPVNQEQETGEMNALGEAITQIQNDLSLGEYDVVVSSGPSFATRRQEAAESVRQLVQAYPALMQIAGDVIVKNLDFPGSEEIAKRMERTIPPNLKSDEAQPPPPPTPVDIKAAAEAKLATAKAEGQELENLTTGVQLMGAIHNLGGILSGMQAQLAQMAGAPPPGQPALAPPSAPPLEAAPPGPDGPPTGSLPPQGNGAMPELEPMPQGGPA